MERKLIKRDEGKIAFMTNRYLSVLSEMNSTVHDLINNGLNELTDEALMYLVVNKNSFDSWLKSIINKEADRFELKFMKSKTVEELSVLFNYAESARTKINNSLNKEALSFSLFDVKDVKFRLKEGWEQSIIDANSIYIDTPEKETAYQLATEIIEKAKALNDHLKSNGDITLATGTPMVIFQNIFLLNPSGTGELELHHEAFNYVGKSKPKLQN